MIASVSADHYTQPLSMGNRQVLMLFTAPSVWETLPACPPACLPTCSTALGVWAPLNCITVRVLMVLRVIINKGVQVKCIYLWSQPIKQTGHTLIIHVHNYCLHYQCLPMTGAATTCSLKESFVLSRFSPRLVSQNFIASLCVNRRRMMRQAVSIAVAPLMAARVILCSVTNVLFFHKLK